MADLKSEADTRSGYIAAVNEQKALFQQDLQATGDDADVKQAVATALIALADAQIAEQQVEVDGINKDLADRQIEYEARVELGNERINIEELQYQSAKTMNTSYINQRMLDVWE
jgi:hypothetical protein